MQTKLTIEEVKPSSRDGDQDQPHRYAHRHYTDTQLLSNLKQRVTCERELTLEIIHLLEEVDRRRLFLQMGFGSLIEFCVEELKYSESAAYRRIAAMRMVRDVPHVESKIRTGELSLAVVARAQTFFNTEAKQKGTRVDVAQKIEVLKELEGQSSRNAEKILVQKSPDHQRPEFVRQVTSTKSEMRLTLSTEALAKLDRLKNLLAHKLPGANYADIIDHIADLALQKIDPLIRSSRVDSSLRSSDGAIADNNVLVTDGLSASGAAPNDICAKVIQKTLAVGQTQDTGLEPRAGGSAVAVLGATTPAPVFGRERNGRYLPAALRRQVWHLSQGQCCFTERQSGRRCGSRYMLEIDHMIPMARGGGSTVENLQLLCRAHNAWKGATYSVAPYPRNLT